MSRVGLKPITVPDKVDVDVSGDALTVKGPKGTLTTPLPSGISASVEDGSLSFARGDDSGPSRSKHGLARALAANAVEGVTKGFERKLEIVGVGYRVAMQGKGIQINVGYSHPVDYAPPAGVDLGVDGNKIVVSGIDKQAVGQVAAEIRSIRPPDSYKGKGIRYEGELVRLKAGKSGV